MKQHKILLAKDPPPQAGLFTIKIRAIWLAIALTIYDFLFQ
jgi:hypothetical protein